MKIEYCSNNSGGEWWLTDQNWRDLEAAGWRVEWAKDMPHLGSDRFLGALATSATREGLAKPDAIAEFERVTGQDAKAAGCECCGPPHNFYVADGD